MDATTTRRVGHTGLLGSQGCGVHRRETYKHDGRNARGGRGQGKRRAIQQDRKDES